MAVPVRIRPKFQVTIPVEVRRKAGIKEGDYVEAEANAEGVLLRFRQASLTLEKQEVLKTAQEKIRRIQEDISRFA